MYIAHSTQVSTTNEKEVRRKLRGKDNGGREKEKRERGTEEYKEGERVEESI